MNLTSSFCVVTKLSRERYIIIFANNTFDTAATEDVGSRVIMPIDTTTEGPS